MRFPFLAAATRFAVTVAFAGLAAPGGAAFAAPVPEGSAAGSAVAPAAIPPEETPDTAARLGELARTLETLLALAVLEHPDALAIPEAEAMAAVAEELIQEGDEDLAGTLLEEAIALLEDGDG